MKNYQKFGIDTITDLKVFLLFLLDNIRYPVDRTTIMEIILENTDELSIDYDQCLSELSESGHLYYDEVDGEKYYMISDEGRLVASELYDSLDKEFRERSLRSAIKYISLSKNGSSIKAYVEVTETKRYRVTLEAYDSQGEIMKTSLTVNSRTEAEAIKHNFESKPDGVYRGVLFSATGRIEYLA
ncbi:MAG: DUF4364 family protein [Clostridia bacterium]|nr:DUF4364 family protein [Clostridia bacterium]